MLAAATCLRTPQATLGEWSLSRGQLRHWPSPSSHRRQRPEAPSPACSDLRPPPELVGSLWMWAVERAVERAVELAVVLAAPPALPPACLRAVSAATPHLGVLPSSSLLSHSRGQTATKGLGSSSRRQCPRSPQLRTLLY